jgi:phage shock protein PspC (stress-responsive transcriptional regulator)
MICYGKNEPFSLSFIDDNMHKQFFLSSTDKKIAGVCGGIAEYFDIDSLLVRVGFIVLAFGFGGGLLAYIILWLLAPTK